MELTPQQLKKLEALAKHADDAEVSTIENFIEIHQKLDDQSEQLKTLEDIKDAIRAFEIPEPKDEQANFDAILAKLDEPIEVELNIV